MEFPEKQPVGTLSEAPEQQKIEKRTLRDYYVMIREKAWLALFAALAVSIPFAYILLQEEPVYSTTATIQFERPEKILPGERVVETDVRSDVDLNTYLQVLTSSRVRNMVIDSLTPEDVKLIQRIYLDPREPARKPPPVAGIVGGGLIVEPVRNSLLVRVSFRHRDPEAAALLANRYVESFIEFLLNRSMLGNETAIAILETQAAGMREEMEMARLRLEQYRQKHNLVSLEENQNIIIDRLKSVNNTLTNARIKRLELEVFVDQVDAFQREGRNLLEIPAIATYGNVSALENEWNNLVRQRDVKSDRYLERHPRMIEIENAITATRQQLGNSISMAVADLRSRLEKALEAERRYASEFQRAEEAAFHLDELAVQFRLLEHEANILGMNYQSIVDRLNQTRTMQAIDSINVRTLDEAPVPGRPDTPNTNRILRFAFGIGMAIFIFLPIGINLLDDRIKSSWDVETYLGVPLAGIIPQMSQKQIERGKEMDTDHMESSGQEAFLDLYSYLKIHSKLDYPRSMLVTSTVPEEGKTFIASTLAAGFAHHGIRTLVVDADLRRPTLHRNFQKDNDHGIIKWYHEGAAIPANPCDDPHLGILDLGGNIHLLRAGGRSKAPKEIMESPAFGSLIDALGKRFDLIIVDSPPLGPVSDGMLLAEKVDEVLYICRFNKAQRKHIRHFVERLKKAEVNLLGVVLNGLSLRRIAAYTNYRYYRSYKRYYHPSDTE